MSIPKMWKTKVIKTSKFLLIFVLVIGWIFSGWPQIWQEPPFPPEIRDAIALNQINNWDFPSDATGWSNTNGSGTNTCGDNGLSTTNSMATWAYVGGGTKAWQAKTGTTGSANYRGYIYQTFTPPGSGTVKAKGRFAYSGGVAGGGSWGSAWVRLDIYQSTTFIGNLSCVTMSSNTSATNSAFDAEVSLTAGTEYTLRVTLSGTVGSKALTLTADDVIVNMAPVGLTASAPEGTTDAQLDWTASTAGSGAPGLHATTPYKVYRKTSSGVALGDYLADTTSNTYTDTTTEPETTYYYAVTNVDTNDIISPLSAEANITTNAAAITFVVSTDTFPNITPGTAVFATTTLSVDSSSGWNVTLSGDNKTPSQNNCLSGSNSITDQTEWIPGSATTTAGNAVRISLLESSGDVLAFRVMTASGTQSFISTDWWGTTDSYINSATTLWAGIASSTASDKRIGESSVGSGGGAVLNTVLYYLDVPTTQQTGVYSCPLTFTATAL